MRWLILFMFTLINLGAVTNAQTPARFHSTWDNKRYDFYVTEEQLKQTPTWAANEEAPPLAPRSALASARKSLETLIEGSDHWQVTRISLTPMWQSWVYLIEFAKPTNESHGPRPHFAVVVLMNGEAVQPKVVPLRPSIRQ